MLCDRSWDDGVEGAAHFGEADTDTEGELK